MVGGVRLSYREQLKARGNLGAGAPWENLIISITNARAGCSPWDSPPRQLLLSSRRRGVLRLPCLLRHRILSSSSSPSACPGAVPTEGCCHRGGNGGLHPYSWAQTSRSSALCRSWGGFLGRSWYKTSSLGLEHACGGCRAVAQCPKA